MAETKISWEEHPEGTVSAWVDRETRKITKEHGEPNPGYSLQWKEEVARLTKPIEAEVVDPIYQQFPKKVRYEVVRARLFYEESGLSYKEIADKLYVSRSTVYRWLKKLGVIMSPRK